MITRKENRWQFWIDAGGTFTDCIGISPDGDVHTAKVLSSGTVKGIVDSQHDETDIVDRRRTGAPDHFYRGYTLTLFDAQNTELGQEQVIAFDGRKGRLRLENSLSGKIRSGYRYELSAGEPAPVLAIRTVLKLPLDRTIPPADIRLGTTAATNALLERRGARIALVTTVGFGDVPAIGTQARPHLFQLNIRKPALLAETVVEVPERIAADGTIIVPLAEKDVREKLSELRRSGIDSLAICLLNAVWNPDHEQRIAGIAESLDFAHISVSHQIAPVAKLLDRCDTTIVDAYLSPVISMAVKRIRSRLSGGRLRLMTSAGGLNDAGHFAGKDAILSGPAGGVAGLARVAEAAGFRKAIGFDMGGTSTDVSRYDGAYEYQFATETAGVRIAAPMLAIETVAAGGGSICRYNDQRFLVGPESGGADPGPACYGRGGPLTLTDVNLFAGRIDPDYFPFPLDRAAVERHLRAVAERVAEVEGKEMTPAEIAEGFIQIANARMATAIKQISTARGYDLGDYVLVSFGGAGAQHACPIARILGMRRILLHPYAGILSAYGMGMADIRRFAEETVMLTWNKQSPAHLEARFQTMEERLRQALLAEEVPPECIRPAIRYFDLRYAGEAPVITVRQPADADPLSEFARLHQQLYGYLHEGRPVEVVAVRLEMIGETEKPPLPEPVDIPRKRRAATTFRSVFFGGESRRSGCFRRSDLAPGDTISGPAVIGEDFSTIVVDPGWSALRTAGGDLLLEDSGEEKRAGTGDASRDPVRLELFNNHLTHIATRMGVTLQKTALSVNVKERLDFSCAILDAGGELIVNAPHIPVHLGAMSESVKGLLNNVARPAPGDVYLSNDPALGGSHLPDLTVMTPVFSADGKNLRFFTASRAHHAEIGGLRPGSGFPFARNLSEEGVVLENLRIVAGGHFQEQALWETLTGGPYPSRAPRENIADIRAQIAANQIGMRELNHLIEERGWPYIEAYMAYIREAAAEKSRAALDRLPADRFSFHDALDDGSPVCLEIRRSGEQWIFDFSGSGPVNANSMNANRAVVQSVLLYGLRCLIAEDIPLNSGVLAPVKLILPEGMLNPPAGKDPRQRAAVFGGNVEISQRVTDVFFGALEIAAAGQGTMNNFIFGNGQFGYYETICGGSGAGPGFDGCSAVHTHMTNTRISDIEVIEKQYPIRVHCFALRRDSGGAGRRRGGDGVIREIEFLAPVDVSLLTQRRLTAPYGLAGGEAGRPGENHRFNSATGKWEELPPLAFFRAVSGDRVRLLTPGGGGYGRLEKKR